MTDKKNTGPTWSHGEQHSFATLICREKEATSQWDKNINAIIFQPVESATEIN